MPIRRYCGNDLPVKAGGVSAALPARGWRRIRSIVMLPLAVGCASVAGDGGIGNAGASNGGSYTAVAIDPAIVLAIEAIFRDARVEIVFCLEASFDPETNAYRVSKAFVAPQSGNTREAAAFSCIGAAGYLHNHPGGGARPCRFSAIDEDTLLRGGYAFLVGWCSSRRFFWALAPLGEEASM